MIPNAVVSAGPYASLWSHLKSIDHALERALNAQTAGELAELDRDRLRALVDFLQSGLSPRAPDSQFSTSLCDYSIASPNYGSAIDLRKRLGTLAAFEDWQKTSKKGFDAKLKRLTGALEDFLERPSGLLPKSVPREELTVLHAILRSLLLEAETALF